MKRFQIILASVFCIFIAQAQLSQLDLSTTSQQAFDLYFDGQLLASEVAQVSLSDITPGNHQLQIVKSFRNNWGNQNGQTLFNGSLNIAANTLVQAVIHQGQFIIQNQTALIPLQPTNVYYGNNHPNNNGNHYGNNGNHQGNGNAHGNNQYNGNQHGHVNPQYGQGNAYGQNPNYMPGINNHGNVPMVPPNCTYPQQPVYNYGPQAMESGAFLQLQATINKQWFSSGQMAVFNQALNSNYFTAAQVRDLVGLFTFDSDQLKVAKKAYAKTIDPQNYFVVNDVLEFNSSVNALSAYIASL